MNATLDTESVISYFTMSDVKEVQGMFDTLQEAGVYQLYRTKGYKHLNKELLFGVYTYVLTNIKLHKEFKKTKIKYNRTISDSHGGKLYRCMVTTQYDVLSLGKEHYHEFLAHLMREYVKAYKGVSVSEHIPDDSVEGRNLHIVYPPQDIINNLVFLRGYYGRYTGQEEFDVMVKSMYEEFYLGETKHMDFNTSMLVVNVKGEIERGTWWRKPNTVGGRVKNVSYGFTRRDISMSEFLWKSTR